MVKNSGDGRLNNLNDPDRPQCVKSGPYFNMSNLFTKIYNMLCYTTNLYLQ